MNFEKKMLVLLT